MKKKLILAIGLLAVGIALFVLSLVSGVKRFYSFPVINSRYDAIYEIQATTRIETIGIFSLKEAKITYKTVDADNNVLAEKTIKTCHTVDDFSITYSVGLGDIDGTPADVIVEVHDAKFNNAPVIVLSSLIIVCSAVMIFFEVRDKKKHVVYY